MGCLAEEVIEAFAAMHESEMALRDTSCRSRRGLISGAERTGDIALSV